MIISSATIVDLTGCHHYLVTMVGLLAVGTFLLTSYTSVASPQFGRPGGFSPAAVTREVVDLANKATDQLLATLGSVSGGFSQVQVIEVLDVETQVVAGTNFKLTLRIGLKDCPTCGTEVEKTCENIVVYRPLQCVGGDCLELIDEEDIRCSGPPPIAGGFSPAAVTREVQDLAKKATTQLLTTEGRVTGSRCSHAKLVDVLEVAKQVVAGTNFKLTLKLEAKEGRNCERKVEKVCRNIVVYRPLPGMCFGGDCLELIRQNEIRCD